MWFPRRSTSITNLPVPFSVKPSGSFDGNDGSWSTFALDVGNPSQAFRVVLSTSSLATWLPVPNGCAAPSGSGVAQNCSQWRGVGNVNGGTSPGYSQGPNQNPNPYILSLGFDTSNFNMASIYGSQYSIGAAYGLDIVNLSSSTSDSTTIGVDQTPVAGVTSWEIFLGTLGLGFGQVNDGPTSSTPSFMETLANKSVIPSRSWGYTAGASYRSYLGNLVLGGYDQSRFQQTSTQYQMPTSQNTLLEVSVKSIAINFTSGLWSPTASSQDQADVFNVIIDSTLPYLYLPNATCDRLAKQLGLQYDDQTDLYTLNNTQRAQNLENIPNIDITITDTTSGVNRTTISFPYAAFDLQASWPIYTNDNGTEGIPTPYFPIRRSPSSTYVLGRVFLQEAYIVADYERHTFTIAQTLFPNPSPSPSIIPIYNTSISHHIGSSGHKSLGTGAIVGIAIGGFIGFMLIVVVVFFVFRNMKRGKSASETVGTAMTMPETGQPPDRHHTVNSAFSDTTYGTYKSELDASTPVERPGHSRQLSELSSDSDKNPHQQDVPLLDAVYELPTNSPSSPGRPVTGPRRTSAISPMEGLSEDPSDT